MRLSALLLLLLPLLTACATPTPQPTHWNSLPAYRLTNGTVELIAVPSIGRIVHYSYVNGPNALWTFPAAGENPKKYTGFKNFGGEKIWLWPQKEWPPAADSLPCTATIQGDTLTLLSDPVPGAQGVKILRHIRMDPSGTGVTIATHLVTPNGAAPRVAIWSVAQVPPGDIHAHLLSPAGHPAVSSLDPSQQLWQPIQRENDWALFRRTGQPLKSGLESDNITSTSSNQTFGIIATSTPPGPFDPGTRAQLYADADRSFTRPLTLPPYIEIEFLSPYLTPSSTPTLTLRWTLEK